MNGPFLLLVLLTLVRLVVALRPYETARVKKQLDALGSDRENDPGGRLRLRDVLRRDSDLGDHLSAVAVLRWFGAVSP